MESELPSYSGADAAWIAGLFDGEGCIMISKPRKGNYVGFTPKARIKMTHQPTVEKIMNLFGGNITYCHSKSYKFNWRPAWEWYIGGVSTVYEFLKIIEPYSITKRDEIKIGIEYCSFMIKQHHPRKGQPRTTEQIAFQMYCREELQRLKTIAYYKDDE